MVQFWHYERKATKIRGIRTALKRGKEKSPEIELKIQDVTHTHLN